MDEQNRTGDGLMEVLVPKGTFKRLKYRVGELVERVSSFFGANGDKEPPHVLVIEGYRGYNILKCNGRFYCLAQIEGAFSLRKFKRGRYKHCFEAETLEEAKRLAEEHEVKHIVPVLVEEGYRGFNVIMYGDTFYAIPQDEGAFDVDRVNNNGYTIVFSSANMEELKKMVDENAPELAKKRAVEETKPVLEQTYYNYNILSYNGKFIGIPQYIGDIDVTEVDMNALEQCYIVCNTMDEVKCEIEKVVKKKLVPKLIKADYMGFNIIEFGDVYYGLAQEEGAFDIERYEKGEYRKVVKADSLWQIKRLIKRLVYHNQ